MPINSLTSTRLPSPSRRILATKSGQSDITSPTIKRLLTLKETEFDKKFIGEEVETKAATIDQSAGNNFSQYFYNFNSCGNPYYYQQQQQHHDNTNQSNSANHNQNHHNQQDNSNHLQFPQQHHNINQQFGNNLKVDQEHFVSKWLNNTFKITTEALDLRSTPLTLQIPPQMTTDVQQANSRSLFKMNTDFWQQARGPPIGGPAPGNLLINTSTPPNIVSAGNPVTSSSSSGSNAGGGNGNSGGNDGNNGSNGNGGGAGDGGPTSVSPVPNIQTSSTNAGNVTGNPSGMLSQSALHHQLQQIHHQQQQQQQQSQQQQNNQAASSTGINAPITAAHLTPNQLTPGGGPTSVVGLQQMQQQLQQNHQQNQQLALQSHPPQPLTPGGSSTPDIKFSNEKFVNEIQLFMHKNAMQQIQHIPRVGLGPGMGAEVKPHQCQQCLKSFSSNHQLVQHIRVHTGEKPYKCSYCDRRFKQLSHVQQHTRLHTGERPYKCHLPDCGRAFIQLSNLQQHLRNHDAQVERAKNRPFHCNICGKGFATESSLRTHTSKELQLHLGVLQQHAALIGGPNPTTCPICHKLFLGGEALMEHMKHTHKDPNASGVANPYLAKRRTANHPCPVCGKHYVNEGSLRKHLACHPETSQLTTSLRMWPCSVCQAVFTHETGLLTHMEHMRMDPKHQFAAQYVLSRAAAERRERDTLLAAAVAVSASGSGLLSMGGGGAGDGGTNSMCASPSAHSDSSSGNGRLSSTGSDPGTNLLNNNNNNCNTKFSDILRAGNNGHLHQQYGVDDIHANRMSLMAAAAGIVGQTGAGVPGSLGSPGVGVDSTTAGAVQAAVVNLAAAMRMGHVASQQSVNNGPSAGGPSASPPMGNDSASAAAAQAAMNAMRVSMADSMMRSSMVVDPMSHQPHHQHHQQNSPEAALRRHQAEALLRSQAEAAIRLAVSVAASNNGATPNDVNVNNPLRHHNGAFGQQQQPNSGSGNSGSQNNSNNSQQSQQHPPQSQTPQLQQQQQQQPQKRQNDYANYMKIT